MADAELDVLVVGAGVVGLACAAHLARPGRRVLVVERHADIALEVTSRNSEIVHAGIYYAPDSLKARLCTEGRDALYAHCRERGVPHRKLGKLIVASDESEVGKLEVLAESGRQNGVPGLELWNARRVLQAEPGIRAVAALHSPETGIVDARALARSFQAEAESLGAELLLGSEVCELESDPAGWRVGVRGAEGRVDRVRSTAVVNAAGLASDGVAALAGIDVERAGYRLRPCKGDYFALRPGAGRSLGRLVYPVPPATGLGIHATLDLAGRIRLGPDAEFVDAPRYDVDPAKAAVFAEAVARWWPGIRASDLQPDQAGVRPRLTGPGEAPRDFAIREESVHGCPGLVSCIGIESPGLTAATAIGRYVAALLASL